MRRIKWLGLVLASGGFLMAGGCETGVLDIIFGSLRLATGIVQASS